MGDTYILTGEYDKAIDKYKEMLVFNPGISANVYCDIGVTYRKKGELDLPLKAYEQGLSVTTDQRPKARLYQEMSWVYQSKSEYEKALKYCK